MQEDAKSLLWEQVSMMDSLSAHRFANSIYQELPPETQSIKIYHKHVMNM